MVGGDSLSSLDIPRLERLMKALVVQDRRWRATIFVSGLQSAFLPDLSERLGEKDHIETVVGDYLSCESGAAGLWFWGMDDAGPEGLYRGSVLSSCLAGMVPIVRESVAVHGLGRFVRDAGGYVVPDSGESSTTD